MDTIFVIEPDFALRTLLAEWLSAAGYTVRQFGRWPSTPGAFASAQALIVDLPSPRLQPSSPYADMNAPRPGLPTIALSTSLGSSLGGDSKLARSLNLAAVLAKPCERLELLAVVKAALGRDPA